MVFLYSLIALFSSLIWVVYFKMVRVNELKKSNLLVLTFVLGIGMYFVFQAINQTVFRDLDFSVKNEVVEKFLLSACKIGFIGELLKVIPFLLISFLFKGKISDSIDVIIFLSVSALGFSAAENFQYALSHQYLFFNERTILGTFGEMFCTSIVAYGVIGYFFYHRTKKPLKVVLLLLLASFLHAFYDFWLDYENLVSYGYIISFVYFLWMISFFNITVTNAVNQSSEIIKSHKNLDGGAIKKTFQLYLIFFAVQFLVLFFKQGFEQAFENAKNTIWFSGLILVIAVYSANKIKKIEGKWNKIKFQFPFVFYRVESFNGRTPKLKFKYRGENFSENKVDVFINEKCFIIPMSTRNSFITKSKKIHIERKLHLKNDETFYFGFVETEAGQDFYLLKPKSSGKNLVRRKYPIVALLSVFDLDDLHNRNLEAKDFQFREWVYLKANH